MEHLEFLGAPIGLIAAIALALVPGWRSTLLTALVAVVILLVLWLLTDSTTECTDDVCRRSLVVWDVYRMVLIGFPGLVVAAVLAIKGWVLASAAEQRRRAEAFWAE